MVALHRGDTPPIPHRDKRETIGIQAVDAKSIVTHLANNEALQELSTPREIIERLFQIFNRLDYATFHSNKDFIKSAVEKLNQIIGENVHHNVLENFQVFKNLLDNEAITPTDLHAITDAFFTFRAFALNTVSKISINRLGVNNWVNPEESLRQRGIVVEG